MQWTSAGSGRPRGSRPHRPSRTTSAGWACYVARSSAVGLVEQADEPVSGSLVQQQLVSRAVRPRLNADAQRFSDRIFESCCRCQVVRVQDSSRPPGRRVLVDLRFKAAHGPAAVGCAVRELASSVVVRLSEARVAVALREPPAIDQFDRRSGSSSRRTVWARSLRLRPSRRARSARDT